MHIPKGYIYFAMVFSFSVEMLNFKVKGSNKRQVKPVSLAKKYLMIRDF